MESTLKIAIFRNIFDDDTIEICRDIVIEISHTLPHAELYVEQDGDEFGVEKVFQEDGKYDYLIVVGGDGTMTHTVSRFKNSSTPPIFGAGKGTSYIHYNYRIGQLRKILPLFLSSILAKTVSVDQAIRLKVRVVTGIFRK